MRHHRRADAYFHMLAGTERTRDQFFGIQGDLSSAEESTQTQEITVAVYATEDRSYAGSRT